MRYTVAMLLVFASFSGKSDDFILGQQQNKLYVYNATAMAPLALLDNNVRGHLSSYTVEENNIICKYNAEIDSFSRMYRLPVPLERGSVRKINWPKTEIQIYKVGSGKLIINRSRILFCLGGVEKWYVSFLKGHPKLKCNDVDTTPIDWVGIKPTFTADERFLCFSVEKYGFLSNYSYLYEVEIATGAMNKLTSGWQPSYSASGEYILYCLYPKTNVWRIYAWKRKAVLPITFDKAFWLYK